MIRGKVVINTRKDKHQRIIKRPGNFWNDAEDYTDYIKLHNLHIKLVPEKLSPVGFNKKSKLSNKCKQFYLIVLLSAT